MLTTHTLGLRVWVTRLLACLLLYCLNATAIAQSSNQVISGKVLSSDTNEPLPGVNIRIKDTIKGVVSDFDGAFTLEVAPGEILQFSYIGYETQEVTVDNQTSLTISLVQDLEQLEEVVVIGYGTQKKSHLTGSISKVENEMLDQIPTARVDEALIGQVSGVNIQMTNPQAGAAPTIRVRGVGSIKASSEPLVVVDGVVVNGDFLASIDMTDVASVEVLKDASSAAIYGSRGGNGVIMITTKSGQAGKTKFSFNSYYGQKYIPVKKDFLPSLADWEAQVLASDGDTGRLEYIKALGTETNWQEVMFDGGSVQNYSLSASGGSENTKFRVSGGYMSDDGVLLTDSYNKLNFRLNLDTKLNDRVSVGIKLNPSYTQKRLFPIGVHDALRQSPWLPLYHDEHTIQFVDRNKYPDVKVGDYAMERHFDNHPDYTNISTTSNASPLAKVLERDRRENTLKVFTNANVKVKLAKGLNFKTSIGGDYMSRVRDYWTGTKADRRGASRAELQYRTYNNLHWVNDNVLTYNLEVGDHEMNAVAGMSFEKWQYESSEVLGTGYEFDYIRTINAASVIAEGDGVKSAVALQSFFGRVNYAFQGKYLASVSARTDGSSKFGSDYRYGFFPAFSLGWRVNEEGFLKNSDLISNLKARFSYGTTGNNSGIGPYDHLGLLSPGSAVMDGGIVTSFYPNNIASPELRWEKQLEINPGVDFGFLDNRIYGSFDWYQRTSDDLLLPQPIPSVTGFSETTVNMGTVENRGVEIELGVHLITNKDYSWTISGNLSQNKNTLVDFAGVDDLISIVDSKRPAEWIASVGQPISSFYGYVMEKEIAPEYLKNSLYPVGGQSQDVYVKDLNGDGEITPDDRTILGSPYPDLVWSVSNTFKVRDIDFSFMFQGSHGAEVRNMDPQYVNNQFSGNQDYNDEFPDADKVVQRIFTDDIVQDASFIALRSLNLGYTMPKAWVNKIGAEKLRFYFSGQNLLYLMSEEYSSFNPEGINQGQDNPLTYGYQRGAAPIPRSYTVGLNLEF
ncbi:TonB-dependent receptor [Algivirga pacifica]|uniref:TonB-dependent receptor n=1 Tax=Algivirga pacifica TaxID=1162670 RepID=A0ABP9DQ72_9BACT